MRLFQEGFRECKCGESHGCYVDSINAIIGGEAVPIDIDNNCFSTALFFRPDEGTGRYFDAFVIPRICDTVEEVE